MADMKRNGRVGLFLPEGAEVHSADTADRDVMTVQEYMKKPHAPVTRGELLAFSQSLVENQVRGVIQYVVDKRTAEMHSDIAAMIAQAIALEKANRWYRRLGRWLRDAGRTHQLADAPEPTDEGGLGPVVPRPSDPDTDYPAQPAGTPGWEKK